LSCAADGASHQALEELAIMRVIPNLKVLVPCDAEETINTLNTIVDIKGPSYVRLRREKEPIIEKKYQYKLGKIETIRDGSDITIIATGAMVYHAFIAANKLYNKKVNAEVLNVHTIKPIDIQTLIKSVKKTGLVVTVEQHQINGGLGGTVAEILSENYPTPMKRMGVKDTFSESARDINQLLLHHQLTSNDIIVNAQRLIEKTRK
jgi:transketolase